MTMLAPDWRHALRAQLERPRPRLRLRLQGERTLPPERPASAAERAALGIGERAPG